MSVNENYKPLVLGWRPKPSRQRKANCGWDPDTRRCYLSPDSGVGPPSSNKVALFHYITKSREDFARKTARGSGMSDATKTMKHFRRVRRCAKRSVASLHARSVFWCCQDRAQPPHTRDGEWQTLQAYTPCVLY
jgi:hypothetical protein